MKRKRLTILLATTLVIGVMLGAVVATLILSNSQTFDLTVTDAYEMEWNPPDSLDWDECKPDDDIILNQWYNVTVIQANLTNNNEDFGYVVKINISFYCDGKEVKAGRVKAAALYKIEGQSNWKTPLGAPVGGTPTWTGSGPNLVMITDLYSGPDKFQYAEIEDISLEANAGAGRNWVQFMIRFWLSLDAPLGNWHIELSVTGEQFSYP